MTHKPDDDAAVAVAQVSTMDVHTVVRMLERVALAALPAATLRPADKELQSALHAARNFLREFGLARS